MTSLEILLRYHFNIPTVKRNLSRASCYLSPRLPGDRSGPAKANAAAGETLGGGVWS
jgi:hypothetical protein